MPRYPFIQARHYNAAARTAIDWVVVHTMETPEDVDRAHKVASWFASSAAPQASAHYCVDDEHVVQCVRHEDIAWHAPGANRNGIGVEHAGCAAQTAAAWDDAYSRKVLAQSAVLVAGLCLAYAIPIARLTPEDLRAGRRGICGHADVTSAFHGGNGHWDPGPHFPWTAYVDLVRAAANEARNGS